jgi:protein-tyrosine phosphatase
MTGGFLPSPWPSGWAPEVAAADPAPAGRPWGAAIGWLAFLGPFFFLSYGLVNWLSSQRTDIGVLVFDWERSIPFLPWSILPYWSIDLLYGLSLFICRDRVELDTHAKRLLTAQIIAVSGFLLFPLRFSFPRPETGGLPGLLFDVLMGFDKPFNQAPSLHIALLVILWVRYAAHLRGLGRWLLHAWFLLIGVSVLTTWQHHFIDLPTGIWVGLLCLVLFPEGSSGTGIRPRPPSMPRVRIGLYYGVSALVLAFIAAMTGGFGWLLLWPAGSLGLVAIIYWLGDPALFRKREGKLEPAAAWLLTPYLIGAWVNSRWWTRGQAGTSQVTADLWLGRLPSRAELSVLGVASLVDLSAELPTPTTDLAYRGIPMLDLVVPTVSQLTAAVAAIESLAGSRPTLVYCALGYSRSAMAVAAWLLASGQADSVAEAETRIRRARPQVVLCDAHRRSLEAWLLHTNQHR